MQGLCPSPALQLTVPPLRSSSPSRSYFAWFIWRSDLPPHRCPYGTPPFPLRHSILPQFRPASRISCCSRCYHPQPQEPACVALSNDQELSEVAREPSVPPISFFPSLSFARIHSIPLPQLGRYVTRLAHPDCVSRSGLCMGYVSQPGVSTTNGTNLIPKKLMKSPRIDIVVGNTTNRTGFRTLPSPE